MQKRKDGFTLAEVMAVMAIIAILGAISAIAVWRYNRKMTQLEYDGIAKEIFVAAQNHLTMAEEQGYLGYSEAAFGNNGNLSPEEKNIYYFVVNDFPEKSSVLDQMLPFGSIDDTVRKGNFIIRYQQNPARVLDVFYSGRGGRYGHNYSSGEYSTLVDNYRGSDKKTQRRMDYSYIIGWYGGKEAESIEQVNLEAPSIKLVNDEQLYLELTNPNTDKTASDYALRIIVEGKSGGKVSLTIKDLYKTAGCEKLYIVLDDISQKGMHFKDIFSSTDALPLESIYTVDGERNLIPGEDITVYATVFSTSKLSGVKNSTKATANSLFDKVTTDTAMVTKVRHLENLGKTVSGYENTYPKAIQKSNLDWNQFKNKVNQLKKMESTFYHDDVSGEKVFYTEAISESGSPVESTEPGTYAPIQTGAIIYDGDKHSISNVKVDSTIPSGLFSELKDSTVSNLKLIDFNVKSVDDAGSLIGKMDNSNVENVVSYFTKSGTVEGQNTGGLIGTMNGGTLTKSGAALTVKGKNAGGLIGTAENVTVKQCYSGGQTENGRYSKTNYNVTATDNAGGLVGNAMGDFQKCYSTCSANGSKAGGFAGSLTGSAVNCYATGLAEWSFADSTARMENCYYFGMVNGNAKGDTNDVAKSINSAIEDIPAIDVWNSFTQYPEKKNALPYDDTLESYKGKYLFRTVFQMEKMVPSELTDESGEAENYFAKIHYGDWPSLETEIVNEKK